MEQKIQELTEKIYQEGVEQGKHKAEQIIKESEEKASDIISEAKKEAERIIENSRKKAEELRRNTESELKLSGSQAVASIKNSIVNLVSAKVLDNATTQTLSDPAVVKEYIAQVIGNWKVSQGEVPNLEVLLPEQKQKELQESFKKGASDLLSTGLEVKFSKNIKSGFRIGPADGSFKISLTDEDFKEFFKEYLRPKTRSFLFGE
ncbi:V-type ATP synthase subunit E [Chitinispirillum alkaliphilum]|nr:V-type ATP synthase subunit E [Chitinispirillum alkaliphilum]